MSKGIYLLFFIFILCSSASGGNTKIIEGKYKTKWETYQSEDQVKQLVLAGAITNALADAFNTKIIVDEVSSIENQNAGQNTKSNMTYTSISNSEVQGEWIRTVDTSITVSIGSNGDKFIECWVKGEARELKKIEKNFIAQPLSCVTLNCKTTSFNNNQNLYVYFKSSRDGYLTIYLDDNTTTSMILPYPNKGGITLANYPVKGDMEYYFFDDNDIHKYRNDLLSPDRLESVESMILTTDQSIELDHLIFIFSPHPFDKPILNQGDKTTPKYIESNGFVEYLQKLRKNDDGVELLKIPVSIKK